MSDLFVNLSKNPTAKTVIKTLRLPVPLPPVLKRGRGPWEEHPLNDLPVVVSHGSGGRLTSVLADTLVDGGAEVWLDSAENGQEEIYSKRGEAWSRTPRVLGAGEELPERLRPHGLVFDGTGIATLDGLKEAYHFFHRWIRKLAPSGRAIVIATPVEDRDTAEGKAVSQALQGFAKSLAKEVGRRGSTAQILYVSEDGDPKLGPVVSFLLSRRSAYISGQPLHISAQVTHEDDISLTKPLAGKVALVTGAARGIGAASARAMAREGAHVICMDLPKDDEKISILAEEIGGTVLLGDVTDEETPKKICDLVKEKFKGIDIVMHNAGITRDKTLGRMDEDRWDLVMNVNLSAILRMNESLVGCMNKGGRMICLASIAGIAGNVGQTNYAASKAGVIGYVEALAPELAEKGIALNAMAPGFIETRLTAAIPAGTRFFGRRLCNLSQGGLPQDVAETAVFLASPGAGGLCGQVLRVCGGSFIGA